MAADVGGDDGGGGKKKKKGRGKKGNPKIDMTPMVDLGFLLLTFFVLTTQMGTPTTMPVVVPADDDKKEPDKPEDKIAAGKVRVFIMSGKNRIYYYKPVQDPTKEKVELNQVGYQEAGIRKVIQEAQIEVRKDYATANDTAPLIVMLKMTDDASYRNMVDILDEMNITQQRKYMLLEVSTDEAQLISDYDKNQNQDVSVTKTLEFIQQNGYAKGDDPEAIRKAQAKKK
jgi:biopolymer transport protein ExbD